MLLSWTASIYPYFPTSAESYAIYCDLSKKIRVKYLDLFVVVIDTHIPVPEV